MALTTGETLLTSGAWKRFWSAATSASVSCVVLVEVPPRRPPSDGVVVTISTLEPSASICFSTALEEPVPTAISTITEPTPIIKPEDRQPRAQLVRGQPRERDRRRSRSRRASGVRVLSATICPSRTRITRRAWAAISSSWVIRMIVLPCRVQAVEDRHHLLRGGRVEVAGRLVGEDHGRVGDERARDRDPLLLAAGELGGRWCTRSRSPTCASASSARSRRACRGTPAYDSGSSTFASARVRGIRLKLWNTNPINRLRTSDERVLVDAADVESVQPVDAAGRRVETAEDVHQRASCRCRTRR